MEKKQGDKQTEEPTADKPTESTAAASTGTSAKDADSSNTSTSAKSSSSGSNRSSSRRSKRGKAASSSAAPKKTQENKPEDKPADTQDDKPAAKSSAASASSTSRKQDAEKSSAGGAGKAAAPGADKPSSGAPRRRSGSATPWLATAIGLLFVLAAVGGWQLWQLDQQRQALAETSRADQQQLADRVEALSGELTDTRSAIDTLEQRDEAIRGEVESALSGQLDKLADRQDGLSERVARIDDRLARGEIAWKTAEVGFLLTRAQERLAIARDPHGAMLALELADERVAALSRPHWLPLRSAISDAIASIEDASEGDRVGQALALRRLGDRVDEWPLAGRDAPVDEEPAGGESTETESAPAADAAWYEKAWAATSGWLTSQVSVTRSDRPVRLRERVATDREMRLWLTAVREALLSRDREALMTTLDESRDWLEAHYAVDASGPAEALEAIGRVRTQFTSREFPSLEKVLRAWERASAHEKARADETGKEAQS